jgi:hypothetical protein
MAWTAVPKSACPIGILYTHWAAFPVYSRPWVTGSLLVSGLDYAWLTCPSDTAEGPGADCEWCINTVFGLPVDTPRAQWPKYDDRMRVFPAGGGLQSMLVVGRIAHMSPTNTDSVTPARMSSLADWTPEGGPSNEVRSAPYRATTDRPTSVMGGHEHLQGLGTACKGGNSVFNHTALTQVLSILGIDKPQTGGRPATVQQSLQLLYHRFPALFAQNSLDCGPILATTTKLPGVVIAMVLAYDGPRMTATVVQDMFRFTSVEERTHKCYEEFGGDVVNATRADTSFRMAETMVCLDIASLLAAASGDPRCLWLRGHQNFGKPKRGLRQVLADQIKSITGKSNQQKVARWHREERRVLDALGTAAPPAGTTVSESLTRRRRRSTLNSRSLPLPTTPSYSNSNGANPTERGSIRKTCLFVGVIQITQEGMDELHASGRYVPLPSFCPRTRRCCQIAVPSPCEYSTESSNSTVRTQ